MSFNKDEKVELMNKRVDMRDKIKKHIIQPVEKYILNNKVNIKIFKRR